MNQFEFADAILAAAGHVRASDAMPRITEVPSTDAHESVQAIYRALSRGNNREAQALARYYLSAKHEAARGVAPVSTDQPCVQCGGGCARYCCTVYGSKALPVYTGPKGSAGNAGPLEWDASQIKQPGWNHVQQAFIDGAREARANPDATDANFGLASDGYTKRIFEEVDPASEAALRTESWRGSAGNGGVKGGANG